MKTIQITEYNVLFTDDNYVMCCYRVNTLSQIEDILKSRRTALHSRHLNSHYPIVITRSEILQRINTEFRFHYEDVEINPMFAVYSVWNEETETSEIKTATGTPLYLSDLIYAHGDITSQVGIFDSEGSYQSVAINVLRDLKNSVIAV